MKQIRDFPRILNWMGSTMWAMEERALGDLFSIVQTASENPSGFVMPDFEGPKTSAAVAMFGADPVGDYSFPVVENIGVIPILGPLVNRADFFSEVSGMATYHGIASQFQEFIDSDLDGIILEIDSPGGSVLGLEELAQMIHNYTQETARAVIAIASPMAASAAYYLAAQCDEVWATPSAMVGSIGTIMSGYDTSRAARNRGYDPIVIKSHELKGAGSDGYTPNMKADLERECCCYFDQFKAAVMRGRGMTEEQVQAVATGQVWVGDAALENGLVDRIGTMQELIAELS